MTRDPLDALGDIGLVRRRLDETELDAVREARRRGRSWTEIATRLGVTRQSAWERWRDLDDERTTGPGWSEPERDQRAPVPEPGPRGPASLRSHVSVPQLVGLPYDSALELLTRHRLFGPRPSRGRPWSRCRTPWWSTRSRSPGRGCRPGRR